MQGIYHKVTPCKIRWHDNILPKIMWPVSVGSSKWLVGKFILVWYCWEFCAYELSLFFLVYDRWISLLSPLKSDKNWLRGGQFGPGVQRNKIKVLFILWSISRRRRCDDGIPQVPSAFFRDGRYILSLTKSKTDKNWLRERRFGLGVAEEQNRSTFRFEINFEGAATRRRRFAGDRRVRQGR
jgi:hypothetical protein